MNLYLKNRKMNRRSFIKISGIGAAALAAGFGTSKIFDTNVINNFRLYGFIPSSEEILSDLLLLIKQKSPKNISVISNDKNLINISDDFSGNVFSGAMLELNIQKINSPVQSDLMIGSSDKIIFNPEENFFASFTRLREKIRNKKACYFFTAEIKKQNIFNDLFNSQKKYAVIENPKGIIDKIDLSKNYKSVFVSGSIGGIDLRIVNGLTHVTGSSCRHKLCQEISAKSPGDVIACVPNKLIIKVETA